MNQGKYVFSQIMGLVSSTSFQTLVNRHHGEYKVKDFSCWKQFLCMAFGQLTHRESLSDTLLCLGNLSPEEYYDNLQKYNPDPSLKKVEFNNSTIVYKYKYLGLMKAAFIPNLGINIGFTL